MKHVLRMSECFKGCQWTSNTGFYVFFVCVLEFANITVANVSDNDRYKLPDISDAEMNLNTKTWITNAKPGNYIEKRFSCENESENRFSNHDGLVAYRKQLK